MNAGDVKQGLINKLGLRGVQRRRLVREAVRNGWIDQSAVDEIRKKGGK